MTAKVLLEYSMMMDVVVAAYTMAIMWRKHVVGKFPFVSGYVGVFALQSVFAVATMFFRGSLGIDRKLDYEIYFYSHWVGFATEHVLMILMIYGVFRSAIEPLQGLHRAGTIVFRWVSVVAIVLSIAAATGPNLLGTHYFVDAAGHIQQAISVLTLCLLLFVCLAIRYLGLTYRSRIFGVSMGLGVIAMLEMVQSAWFSTTGALSLYSPIYLFGAVGSLLALGIWGFYFAVPEPSSKMVLLPTTSPYFTWNRISEALGNMPGEVAVLGFKPEMLSTGEVQMMTTVSEGSSDEEQETPRLRGVVSMPLPTELHPLVMQS